MTPPVRLQVTSGPLSASLTANLADLYLRCFAEEPFGEGPEDADRFHTRIQDESIYRGFRLVTAAGDETIGFAYGYQTCPGHWWTDAIATALPDRLHDTYLHAFGYIELAVDSAHRGRGVGRRLHCRLLQDTGCRTGVLTTPDADTAARRLYLDTGWRDLVKPFYFSGSTAPYAIMGRRLP